MNTQLVNSLAEIIQSLTLEEKELLVKKIEPNIKDLNISFNIPKSSQEKAQEFMLWANSHRHDSPILSDEAINRESIYSY